MKCVLVCRSGLDQVLRLDIASGGKRHCMMQWVMTAKYVMTGYKDEIFGNDRVDVDFVPTLAYTKMEVQFCLLNSGVGWIFSRIFSFLHSKKVRR